MPAGDRARSFGAGALIGACSVLVLSWDWLEMLNACKVTWNQWLQKLQTLGQQPRESR